ncbi:unnamed protein product [Paramecium sonneborni]|uniref:Ubiquitin-like domain-containing protein n=1 Tax=Paramecium sonneborni TaxID=65129 RepID=A0A8S1MPA0_9CILI|nr:unnamed protein product [Paramecium sonneborni]
MGVCSNKSKKSMNQYEEQYIYLLDIQHPANVNHKYANHFTLIQNQYTGQGIRRTHQYTTILSRIEWENKQNEFWDSYKDSMHWSNIRKALSQDEESTSHLLDLESSLAILALCKLKMIRNTIQLLISEKQELFQVPVFIINEPISLNNQQLLLDFQTSQLKVRIRSSKLPQDFLINIENTSTVLELKFKILEASKEKTCRLYLNGKELIDQNYLGNYKITSGTIIQAFL